MCLAVPGKVVEISGDEATIEVAGISQRANIGLMPDIEIGEWCLVHTGFIIQRLSEEEAEETLRLLREYIDAVPEMTGDR
ncbi:HypC/HybG/HupF family hydrogenase formation chaperone, partial [bacterium]|nr:HypC/HybG/HupF family hydrogenase formation chaperone [bacterium]